MAVGLYALVAAATFVWIYFLWTRRRYYKVAWQLPGPLGLPFIGLGVQMMNPETFLQFMDRTVRQYRSPLITWMGTNCFLYVNDPETVETVFNSPHCTNKGVFYRFMSSAIGDGLFTSSSPRWNKHRRLINPAFSRPIIQNFVSIFCAEADVLAQKLSAECDRDARPLEIYEILKKSVLEIACQTTMGKRMNFQNDGSATIFEAYSCVTEVCVKRMLSPWFHPDFVYHRSTLFARQQKCVNVLLEFVENLLQQGNKAAIERAALKVNEPQGVDKAAGDECAAQGISKSKSIFVEQVRNCVEQQQFSWEDVRDEANVIIAATFETTSTALYLVCLCLAMHPDCQDKLYNELVELFPSGADDISASALTGEQLERMKYTEMVINEAMRLFSPVPIVLRSASADFPLRNGIIIPRGTQIGIDIYNMQRNESVWGPEARRFRPELHFGPAAATQHPFAFIPFTKGLRMCIGYRYALTLMKVMLAKIFRDFRIRTDATPDDLVVKGTISLKLREYPLCTVERRRSTCS